MSTARGLTEPQVLAVGRGLLTELARLHEAGGVSGAVGPATVLVNDDGAVRLVDGPADRAYASPEVLTGQPPTARSDLYSAGALLAHLFRGEPTLPPSVADLDPGVAWLLGPVLAADPATRPGSAAAMVAAVDQLAEQRHGADWRVAAGLAGAAGVAGAVPVLVLATGGAASAAGAAAGGAAGLGAGAVGTGGAGAGGAAGGAASVAGTGASGQVAAAGGVVTPQGGVLGGVAAPGAGTPAAAGGASASGAAGTGQGVAGGGVQAAGHTSHAVGGGISKGLAVKLGAAVAAGAVGVAGTAAAVILLTGGETKTVEVPATSDIYLAGASEEMEAQLSDPGTRPVSVDVDGAGTVSFPSVEGELSACSGCEPESPDGGNISFGSTGITAFNGIAGVTFADRTLFVVGVFVGDDQPTQPDDAVVDLSGADDETTHEPGLGEPFFIGDGETGDGEVQEVVVPEDATTLYVGFADAYGFYGTPGAYGDNEGSVDVEVSID
ncbi:hypothetical protein SFC88_22440 [Nocardioides sp. HM23]|uniref:hypothetical protein n=1 Tax=Nocardioides bizhenqiangii TaxID=3095076 RepID=UPI002ACA11E5|nr:hypothetical protein [Nocardioides sp. HM23]MDZ5623603.1 hypothetical protein [Nocardioides sp. HM23]